MKANEFIEEYRELLKDCLEDYIQWFDKVEEKDFVNLIEMCIKNLGELEL